VAATLLIVETIMRRGTMPGQGANVCDLGRDGGLPCCYRSNRRHFSELFNDPAQPKINVIARMAPMTGVLVPSMTESGLAKLPVTP
jgi:hypothetical protein